MNAQNQANENEPSNNINNSTDEIIRKNFDGVGVSENNLEADGSKSCSFRKKYLEKITIVVLLVLLVILVITVIVVSIYYVNEKKNKVCESPECIKEAAYLLMSMNQSADPCDDFYEYACGNWAENHPPSDFSDSNDWFNIRREKVLNQIRDALAKNSTEDEPLPLIQAKEMYAACMDIETLDKLNMQPVIDFMKSVKLPPFPTVLNLTKSNNNTNFKFDWLSSIVRIKRKIDFDILIGFKIDYDSKKNSTIKRLMFRRPSSGDMFSSFTNLNKEFENVNEDTNEVEDEKVLKHKIYKQMMKEALKEVVKCNSEDLYNETRQMLDNNIDKVLSDYIAYKKILFEKPKSNKTTANKIESRSKDEFIYYTAEDLQNLTDTYLLSQNLSKIELFQPYLMMIFNGTGVKLNFSEDIIMTTENDINTIKNTLRAIQNTTMLNLELFVWLQIMEHLLPQTTSTLKEMYDKYNEIAIPVSRSLYCAKKVNKMIGMAISYAVVEKSFTTTTLPKIQRMFLNIKNSFESLVSTLSWMDLPTKKASFEKVRNMKSAIGFPEWLFVPGKLEKYYEGLVTDPKTHLKNLFNLLELNFNKEMKDFRKPYKFDWDFFPTVVNAYHTPRANAITIPFMIIQHPFYNFGLEALNYGKLGAVLGHELTHGFDNNGRKFNKDGTYLQWWSNSSIEKYENKTQCFVQQYSNFYLPEIDDYVNGNLTLGDNIADNEGLRIALRAYWLEKENVIKLPGLSSFSVDQLFFLSFANVWCNIKSEKSLRIVIKDSHSPSHLRVKGTLQNMPEFARAWNCPLNSTMNPLKKCIIF